MRFAVATLAVLLCAACAEDSALPEPTGKGTIRGINAIKASPGVEFKIEERALETINYKSGSPGVRYDDFEYNFNFDAVLAGDISQSRIASVAQKVDASRDYTFVLTGDLTNTEVLVWDGDERTFADTDTVLEVRFAHLAESLGEVDIFVGAQGTAPVAGAEIGTLAYGESLEPMDLEADDYVITMTASGDPSTIVYQTGEVAYPARSAFIAAIFDGDELDTGPYNLRLINLGGSAVNLPDLSFPPTIRFIHAASELATSDIYSNEGLTDLVVADHAYGDITTDLPAASGTREYWYTPAGNTGAVLFEDSVGLNAGSHTEFIVHNTDDGFDALTWIPDRRSVSTHAKLSIVNAASNHEGLDFFLVRDNLPIDSDEIARSGQIAFPATGTLNVAAGSVEMYLTTVGERTVVAGPLDLDFENGDVVEVLVLDTVDPATAELVIVPAP